MKIAVATDDFENITGHVGRCKAFMIFTVEDGKITQKETRINDFTNHHRQSEHHHRRHGHGHNHNRGTNNGHQRLAEGLKDCEYLMCHGCGWRLQEDLKSQDIIPFFTTISLAEEAVVKLEQDKLENNTEMVCNSH